MADKSKNPEYRVWARCGILSHVWSDDVAALHKEARNVVTEIASQFDQAGQSEKAEKIREQLREASMVDLMLVLRWVGSADLDLLVTQPDGQVCNYKNRSATNGGRLVHDDGGSANEGSAKRFEQYICRIANNGEYTATIRFVLGKAVSGTAVLDIIQNSGSPEESRTSRTIKLSREDATVTIPLKNGRRGTP